MKKFIKIFLVSIGTIFLLMIATLIYIYFDAKVSIPEQNDLSSLNYKVENPSKDFYRIGRNKLRKNSNGLWELYVEGKPFERGVIIGKLTQKLIYKQEKAFVDQISKLIPSKNYLYFLKYFIAWFNRDLDQHINKEYLDEIYGISLYASDEFSYISDNYQRILNYHAAHDIGHALLGMNMVGCTSFSVWNDKSQDSSLIIGRNFDFYVGDKFAEDKLICFVKPEKGYGFVIISWGGMIGAVSGMNTEGLTVTLNAAKSEIPFKAKTPVSILAREILQYASTIEEALKIAKQKQSFISESIMIGSAKDNKTIIIEKSTSKTILFSTNDNCIICSNHYQSDAFSNDEYNIENISNSSSKYRFLRVEELLKNEFPLNYSSVATILRNRNGLNNKNIGMGNEKSINQLIAHHSIIFKPKEKFFWISTSPYQLGNYVAYNLDSVFKIFPNTSNNSDINIKTLEIPKDTFVFSEAFKNYQKFISLKEIFLQSSVDSKFSNDLRYFDEYIIKYNPFSYQSYQLAGNYNFNIGNYKKALLYYYFALNKEISTNYEKNDILRRITEIEKMNSNNK